MEGRIFGGNEETMISMTGRKETCLEFIPPPTEKALSSVDRILSFKITFINNDR